MKVRGRISLLVLNLLACNLVVAANYYELLGLPKQATPDAVRQKCMGVPLQKNEQARAEKAYTQAVKKLGVVRIAEDRVKLKREVERLKKERDRIKWKMDRSSPLLWKTLPAEIKNACEILRDPRKKYVYDAELYVKETQERFKKERKEGQKEKQFLGVSYYKELEIPKNATLRQIKERCDAQQKEFTEKANKKKRERDAATSLVEKNQLTNELAELEKKLANIKQACPTLLDPQKKKEYDQQLKPEVYEEEYAGIFGAIKKGVRDAKKDADKLIVDLLGEALSRIPIPDAATSVFNQKLAMRNMSFVKAPMGPNVRTGLGFTGTMFFNNFAVKGTVYVIRDREKKMQYSLAMEVPEYYKISSMFPKFKKLDALSLPKGKFVLSSYDYYDTEGYSIKRGFNFAASLDLTGPLKIINTLKDKAKNLKSIIVRAEPIRFQGVIPVNILKTEFSAIIPIYLGIDFTKIARMPKSVVRIFKEITTDDLQCVVTAPPTLSFTIERGVRLVLGTQKAPIRLSAFGLIEPTSFSLGMRMRNMLELKWLALGNAGIQIDWDEALMPAAALLGIPFTGIGVNGQIDVGKPGESRAVFIVSAGARVSSSSLPDLVFETEAKNIRFADLIRLFLKVAAKTKVIRQSVPFSKLPDMTLERVRGFLALEDTKIAGKSYDAGFALEVDALFFNRRAGFSFDLKHAAMQCSGSGYISNINVKIKGKDIFRLTGPPFITKAGKSVEGPSLDFQFGLKKPGAKARDKEQISEVAGDLSIDSGQEKPAVEKRGKAEAKQQLLGALEGRFGVRGILEVPAVGLKQSVDFEWYGWNLRADLETTYAGFTVVFGVQINLKAGMEDVSPYELARREVEHLLDQKDPTDSNTVAAQEIMKKVDELEAAKRYEEAKVQLGRAKSVLAKARYKPGKQKKDVKVPDISRVEGMKIAQFEQVKTLLIEISTLANRVQSIGQEGNFKYEQALRVRDSAVKEYVKFQDPEKLKELKDQLRFQAREKTIQEGEGILVNVGARVDEAFYKMIGKEIIDPLKRSKL